MNISRALAGLFALHVLLVCVSAHDTDANSDHSSQQCSSSSSSNVGSSCSAGTAAATDATPSAICTSCGNSRFPTPGSCVVQGTRVDPAAEGCCADPSAITLLQRLLDELVRQYSNRKNFIGLDGLQLPVSNEGSAYDATKDTVDKGNSPFGAAILANKPEEGYPWLHADANKVQTAGTPTAHGEISTINSYFSKYPDAAKRVPPSDTIFLSTHQPCSMCSSGLAFGGFRRVFYGFDFGMQVNGGEGAGDILDVSVIEEVFNTECGLINHTNGMYTIVPVRAMLLMEPCDANATIAEALKAAQARYAGIVEKYKELGRTFQERMSAAGGASDVQLMASACTGCAPFPRPTCPQEIL